MDIPQSLEVTLLDNRKVKVQKLRWKAYKALKTALASRIGANLGRIIQMFQSGQMGLGVEMPAGDRAVSDLSAALDDITEQIVAGCVREPLDLETVDAVDLLAIRDAGLKVNPISQFVALEGNCFAALMPSQATAKTENTKTTEPAPTGG